MRQQGGDCSDNFAGRNLKRQKNGKDDAGNNDIAGYEIIREPFRNGIADKVENQSEGAANQVDYEYAVTVAGEKLFRRTRRTCKGNKERRNRTERHPRAPTVPFRNCIHDNGYERRVANQNERQIPKRQTE